MKNKKIIAIIILIIGLLLIVLSLFFNNSEGTKKNDLEFKNLQITSSNTFTIDVYNNTNSKIKSQKKIIYLQNESNELVMSVVIEIPDLKIKEVKTIEYSQAETFEYIPTNFYVKEYNEEETLKENISTEANLSNILVELIKEVVNEKDSPEMLKFTITALDLKNKYYKNLSELEKYECSLENTYVEVEYIDNNYNYTTYLECKAFMEENTE